MNKKNMNILLCGLLVKNGNLGCIALTYSALSVLQSISEKMGVVFNYKFVAGLVDDEALNFLCEVLNINRNLVDGIQITDISRNKSEKNEFLKIVREWADVAIDATQGDSFTDIYGRRRFINYTYAKILIERNGVPLLLAPQTYGPFNNAVAKIVAGYTCQKSSLIMSRDEISRDVLLKMGVRKPIIVVSDMAFFLPYQKQELNIDSVNIGLNVSGLLWNGGYTEDNQFGLSVDYQRLIRTILKRILSNSNYKVYLLGHVIDDNPESLEDDYSVCKKLAEEFSVECAPKFVTPIEAKSFISGLDVFIGSRMHATIASFSSGVATIPLAYSRKFVGLFDNLKYPYVLDLRNKSESELVNSIDEYICDYRILEQRIFDSQIGLEDKKRIFFDEVSKWLKVNYER